VFGDTKMTTALLDRLTITVTSSRPATTAGALKAATTIKQPALAPSPQPRPAPTPRALPSRLDDQRGPLWTPIGGPSPTPIDKETPRRRILFCGQSGSKQIANDDFKRSLHLEPSFDPSRTNGQRGRTRLHERTAGMEAPGVVFLVDDRSRRMTEPFGCERAAKSFGCPRPAISTSKPRSRPLETSRLVRLETNSTRSGGSATALAH
jgi:hypothetical protein